MKYAVLQLPRLSDMTLTYENRLIPWLRHPVYAWTGLRPALAQHTAAEHAAIKKWAAGRSSIVEIGVAEGVSALAMRETMNENATLYLIDPFHLSRFPALNFVKRTARRAVASCPRGNVVWIDKFSYDAVRTWSAEVDLLMIDGDHSEWGVQRDWDEWSPFIRPGGAVIFHDSRTFEEGWTTAADGPVKLVDRFFRNGESSGWEIVDEIHSLVVVRRQT